MSSRNQHTGDLLEEIPSFQRTPEQVAHWRVGGESPTYRLLRNPNNLEEISTYRRKMAIWRDNGTLTYVSACGSGDSAVMIRDPRYLLLGFWDKGPTMTICGSTDDAAAQTAAFFLSFEKATEESTCLVVRSNRTDFDFRAAGPQCLTHILDVVPSCRVELSGVTLSVAQSIVLATRRHCTWLYFLQFVFEDDGAAFVSELENRRSSFGSLAIDCAALNDNNLKRLLQVDVIDHLELPVLENDKLALLPLSAKVESLDYCMFSSSALDVDLHSVDIVARKLHLSIGHEEELFPTDLMLSFWRRVADLGHFEELGVVFHGLDYEIPACVVPELIRAVLANSNLKVFHLSNSEGAPEWGPHIETLFKGLKDHKELRTPQLNIHADALATHALDTLPYITTNSPELPSQAHLLLSHKIIASKYPAALKAQASRGITRQYLATKGIPSLIFNAIHWQSLKTARNTLPIKIQTFSHKLLSNWVPTNSVRAKREPAAHPGCPHCTCPLETFDHVLQCPSQLQWRQLFLHDLEHLLAQHTPTELKQHIAHTILTWLNDSPNSNIHLVPTEFIIRGYIPSLWVQTIHNNLDPTSFTRSGTTWATQRSTFFITRTHHAWTSRCNLATIQNETAASAQARIILSQNITDLYNIRDQCYLQYPFEVLLDHRLSLPTHLLSAWLTNHSQNIRDSHAT